MKTKLPKPFHTARVGEALSSLTNYVREALSSLEMAALVTAVASVVIVVRGRTS